MKKLITQVAIVAIIGFLFIGCEKQDISQTVNGDESVQNDTKAFHVQLDDGYVYVWDYYYGWWFIEGYYMRTFKLNPESGKYECDFPAGNCLPDVYIYKYAGPKDPKDPGAERESNTSKDVAIDRLRGEASKNYADPLLQAMEKGQTAIKMFFNNQFAPKTKLPDEVMIDFKDDKLTIKQFPEGYFIVNINATTYDDIPDYEWINE